MRHDVDPENVLSLSARFRSRFFRRFILGRFPGHVFWTFLDHVFWTFYFCTFDDHDGCEKLAPSDAKRKKKKNVTGTRQKLRETCNRNATRCFTQKQGLGNVPETSQKRGRKNACKILRSRRRRGRFQTKRGSVFSSVVDSR